MTKGKPTRGVQLQGGGLKGGKDRKEGVGGEAGRPGTSGQRPHLQSTEFPSVAAPFSAQRDPQKVNNRLLPGSSPLAPDQLHKSQPECGLSLAKSGPGTWTVCLGLRPGMCWSLWNILQPPALLTGTFPSPRASRLVGVLLGAGLINCL